MFSTGPKISRISFTVSILPFMKSTLCLTRANPANAVEIGSIRYLMTVFVIIKSMDLYKSLSLLFIRIKKVALTMAPHESITRPAVGSLLRPEQSLTTSSSQTGGDGGIRTLDRLLHDSLGNYCIQPLCHISK